MQFPCASNCCCTCATEIRFGNANAPTCDTTLRRCSSDLIAPIAPIATPSSATGFPAKGQAVLDVDNNTISATLDDVPATGTFDLYFVKNVEGSGRTARPDSTGDILQRVGGFVPSTTPGDPPGRRVLNLTNVAASIMHFDIDLVVVTRAGSKPDTSRIAVGARTLMEKRLFRARFGQTSPSVTGDCVAGDTSVRVKFDRLSCA